MTLINPEFRTTIGPLAAGQTVTISTLIAGLPLRWVAVQPTQDGPEDGEGLPIPHTFAINTLSPVWDMPVANVYDVDLRALPAPLKRDPRLIHQITVTCARDSTAFKVLGHL